MSDQSNPHVFLGSPNHRIKQAFSLTEADLEANRSGRMIPSQQERVENRWGDKVWSLDMGFAIAIVFACSSFNGSATNGKGLGVAVLCGAILLAPLALLMLSNMKDDISANQVLSFQGPVKCAKRRDKNVTRYRVAVGQKSFQVEGYVYDAFVEGKEYILYYTPTSETLLAAEHVFGRTAAKDDQTPAPEPLNPPTPPHADESSVPGTLNPLVAPSIPEN